MTEKEMIAKAKMQVRQKKLRRWPLMKAGI